MALTSGYWRQGLDGARDDVDAERQHRDVEHECQYAVNQRETAHRACGHRDVGDLSL